MATTLLLDRVSWDLVLDVDGDIAVAADPYSLAQDAASAIRLFQGEMFFDTARGVPWRSKVLGRRPPIALLRALLVQAAMTVPDVSAAACYITGIGPDRVARGQVQVTSASTGLTSAANF